MQSSSRTSSSNRVTPTLMILPRHVRRPSTVRVRVTLAHEGESTAALVARADEAMYRAKQKGRNQVITINGQA